MDNSFEKALDFVNYRVTLNNKRSELKARVDTMLTYSINGGTFKISPELIVFVKYLADLGKRSAVLIDEYQNPIEVSTEEFLAEITSRYFEVTNEYHAEYASIRRARSVSSILDIPNE